MKRVTSIYENHRYKEYINEIAAWEQERLFCRHTMEHFLAVARIATIMQEERKLHIERSLIYAASLLHDIGRHIEYQNGTPHEEASAILAIPILETVGYNREEIDLIVQVIKYHGSASVSGTNTFSGILYDADKASRSCYSCDMEKECHWSMEKKNLTIQY